MLTKEICNLSTQEKLNLVQDLWDDILQHPGSVGLSEEQKRQLDSEYKEYLKDPKEGRPWKSIKDDILGQL